MENKVHTESSRRGRVVAEFRGGYKVINENGEFFARVTGKKMFNATSREDYPAVGDWVLIDELLEGQAVIKEILPRKTIIKRKANGKETAQIIASNIDVAFVVESLGRDWSLNRLERYFAIAYDGNIKPAVILNKVDLISKEELEEKISEIKNRFADVDIIATSSYENIGIDELLKYIEPGKTYCFLGSSGVGKSSLINKLLGKDVIKTEEISFYANRGRHVTTARQIYFLPALSGVEGENGGVVIDNPGMREVGMADSRIGVDSLFNEMAELAVGCKFSNCTHTNEKGCKILEAVEAGEIDKEKYLNYLNLKKEADFYEMSEIEKKEKEKDFGKMVKGAKKTSKDIGHKDY